MNYLFTITCLTIFITVIRVDCGLVKDFIGTVKEDVHFVVDNTVNIIGKGTHKVTEGFGVFIHRKEGTRFPEHESVTSIPVNQVSNTEKTDNDTSGDHKGEQNVLHSQSTPSAAENTTMNNNNNLLEQHNNRNIDYTTESNTNKNVPQPEVTFKKNEQTTNVSTTEIASWFNSVESRNESVNELGAVESNILNNKTRKNETAKFNEMQKLPEDQKGRDYNLVSDQMFFKDNKPQYAVTDNRSACSEGLVRAANGDCLKPVQFKIKHHIDSYSLFQADGCPTGYARAEDRSCQKIIG